MNDQLKEILARVFNLESPDSINDNASLIADLGADSLDFVEIIHLIEKGFGVVIKTDEIMLGGSGLAMEELFVDGLLTSEGTVSLQTAFPVKKGKFIKGMSKVAMFSLLTVADLVVIVRAKLDGGEKHA